MIVPKLTNPRVINIAHALITHYEHAMDELKQYRLWTKKPELRPLIYRIDKELWQDFYDNYISQRIKELELVKTQILEFIHDLVPEYRYLSYLYYSPIPEIALVSILAFPPDVTWIRPRYVHTWTWVTFSFLPPKTRASRIARHFKKTTIFTWYMNTRRRGSGYWLNKYHSYVAEFFEKQRHKYEEKINPSTKKEERRVILLAIRDTIRVYLGNAWLIATLDAYNKGLITKEDIEMPYPLAKGDVQLHELIDPEHTLPSRYAVIYKDYTWKTLKEIVED